MLYGYRQLHCTCESRWYLQRYCRDAKTRFDTSNFGLDRPKGKNEKVIELKNAELGGKTMKEFAGLREKNI